MSYCATAHCRIPWFRIIDLPCFIDGRSVTLHLQSASFTEVSPLMISAADDSDDNHLDLWLCSSAAVLRCEVTLKLISPLQSWKKSSKMNGSRVRCFKCYGNVNYYRNYPTVTDSATVSSATLLLHHNSACVPVWHRNICSKSLANALTRRSLITSLHLGRRNESLLDTSNVSFSSRPHFPPFSLRSGFN